MAKTPLTLALGVLLMGFESPLPAAEPQLAHAVYFTLKDRTKADQERLVEACEKYLSGHEGTVYFAAGTLAAELQREVNDRGFDVSLLIVFRDKAAHEAYQTAPRHLKFIEQCAPLWDKVRVFDSYVGRSRQ